MKVVKLACPVCGANIEANEKMLFCSYCGAKLFVDDESTNININFTKHDEARIRESERKERVRLKELEYEERINKHNDKVVLLVMGILFLVAFLCFGIGMLFEYIEKPKENEIAIPTSSNAYEGDNYEQVLAELENIGFTNIETKENPDLITGWISNEGDVDRVSIDGDYNFDEGDKFSKDAKVIITYHTFKNN